MKSISRFLTALGLSFVFTLVLSQPVWAENNADLPTEKTLKSELAEAEKLPDGEEKTSKVATIQASLDFLQQIQTQQKNNNDLQDTLIDADSEIQKNNADLQNLKKQLSTPNNTDYASQSLANLQAQVEKLTNQQQDAQSALSVVNTQLAGQSSVSERAQTALTDNVKRTQELNQKLADPTTSSLLKQQIQLELQLIELKNIYNQVLLKNSDQLTVLYQSRYELLNTRVQALQQQIVAIQDVINQKNLAKTQNQVEQAQQQSQNVEQNPLIQKELNLNAQLSQYLLEQTEKTNTLTQDELRMRNVLDNLTQTQRTIDEQISALQGTLVLSRIIQQQKQKLPTNLNIQGLSKQIADLRVQIFDITQKRNELYDIDAYISKIEQDENKSFTPAEKTQLTNLLTERRKVGSDLIKSLNNQLNLAISLELTQQQITQISDQIQSKLDQQSFWVKSNNPINLDWFKKLPMSLKAQFDGIGKKLGFPTNFDNLPYLLTYVFILFVIGGLIFKFKESIKQRLAVINGEINTLRSDSQWHTPLALFYTALLSLSGTLWFLAACQLLGFFFVKNPQEFWEWSLSMAGYWWFFSFVLAILRPNGILVRHFGFAKESAASLQDVTKRIIVSVVLLLNTSIFSNVMDTGLANDVLGEINTIVALLFCIVIIAPRFVRTEKSLSSSTTDQRDRTLLKIMRVLLQLLPVILIALIALGYYYTALNLITHIINTYIAWVVWSLVRHTIYRGVTVASRRLAYRRLQEKRQQKQQDLNDGSPSDDVVVITEQEEGLALNEVRSQLLRFADLFIWTALFAIFYYVWSDLVTVVSYLRDITLWQQTSTTEAGVVTETISLFNLIVALIIVVITYILVRNIQGILEVLIFSRVKLSQGTPYTITTLLTYIFVAVGGAWAFSTLGMSWSKLQWLFAALSVGLGFGMQEIFANFVSGIILLFERPIRVGDTVTINGVTGTVAKIRIRAITMIDPDRKEVIVPNKSFVTGQVINWALSNTVTRLVVSVGVAYGSDLDLVKRLLLQAAHEQPSVLKDPEPRALFLTFGASTLDHELRVYVGQVSERNDTLDALNRRVNELFAENNIDIAFNQLDIFIKNKDTGEEIPFIDVAKLAQNH
ncbi:mechanosensitive channel MscK [Haemophilus parainfluenzae]|uniref:mechanosensitive channel MscK n=1 Tax=Haemophilus parainfluenzae TaxID=729 RepID=UPI00122C532F|nr:mechanosensitive channel MscK [Haemophilus parainfluenzae]KAB1991291.1 mechanosensitive channel MscK [Haemophilus parainfluenzae]MBS6188455.1 mechanosensitive channel MscK [Haemophilus parainfluenzae]MDU4896834.1 mechanosensitive channel MscK [Haemophilus parainfluenzae]MDU6707724.1 mechanosensitive channel MscK [Haemophilus parainfluenzae]QAT95044.2 mechanosensitive channel MscK [Haemophilus parainfluenzae]